MRVALSERSVVARWREMIRAAEGNDKWSSGGDACLKSKFAPTTGEDETKAIRVRVASVTSKAPVQG